MSCLFFDELHSTVLFIFITYLYYLFARGCATMFIFC